MADHIGIKIAEVRKSKGLSQQELANKTNINIRTIQRIEAGEVNPRKYTLRILSENLGYDFLQEEKSQNDSGKIYLILLHISNVFPILVVALAIWASKKDESPRINHDGKVIMNYQLLLIVLWIIGSLMFTVVPYFGLNINIGTMGTFEIMVTIYMVGYYSVIAGNLILTAINVVRISSTQINCFYPQIKIIR